MHSSPHMIALATLTGALSLACGTTSDTGFPGAAIESALEPAVHSRPAPARPFVRVLGTVQDGGLPHAGCSCETCVLASNSPAGKRWVASLAIVLPGSGEVYLIDATPDLPEQIEQLSDTRSYEVGRVDRSPVSGIFLTHAHMGHYLGLAHLGYEVMHAEATPVFGTPSMNEYLASNGPWSQLVEFGNIALHEVVEDQPIELGEGVSVRAIAVPHRKEFTDTVGFLIEGPLRSMFYVPDTDAWNAWSPPIQDVLAGVDIALVDGTFYSLEELPGRSISEIGHPLITQSMEVLQNLVATGALQVYFTHINHSNPALDRGSDAAVEIEDREGFHVLAEGQEFPL